MILKPSHLGHPKYINRICHQQNINATGIKTFEMRAFLCLLYGIGCQIINVFLIAGKTINIILQRDIAAGFARIDAGDFGHFIPIFKILVKAFFDDPPKLRPKCVISGRIIFQLFLQFPNHTFGDGLFDFAQNRTGLDKFTADVQIKAGRIQNPLHKAQPFWQNSIKIIGYEDTVYVKAEL